MSSKLINSRKEKDIFYAKLKTHEKIIDNNSKKPEDLLKKREAWNKLTEEFNADARIDSDRKV